jgi:hypothetical protein
LKYSSFTTFHPIIIAILHNSDISLSIKLPKA